MMYPFLDLLRLTYSVMLQIFWNIRLIYLDSNFIFIIIYSQLYKLDSFNTLIQNFNRYNFNLYVQASCVRRPKFILCTGGNPSSYIPTHTTQSTPSRWVLLYIVKPDPPMRHVAWYIFYCSGLFSGNVWRNLSSWMPQRETSTEVLCF